METMQFLNTLPNPYEVKKPPVFKSGELFKSLDVTVVDIETTGLDPLNDRIISISLRRAKQGEILEPLYLEVDPEIVIPPVISALTGLSNYSLAQKKAPVLDTVIDQIAEYIGDSTIVAHNAQFDRSFVNPQILLENGYTQSHWIENNEHIIMKSQFGGAGRDWLCTYRLAWHCYLVDYDYQQIILKNEALRYWLEPTYIRTGEAHNAANDSLTTLRIFQHICSYAEHKLGIKTLKQLFELSNTVKSYSTMPFGEYKGEPFSAMPNDYIEYALLNFDKMDYELGLVLQEELTKRRKEHQYFARYQAGKHVKGSDISELMNVGNTTKAPAPDAEHDAENLEDIIIPPPPRPTGKKYEHQPVSDKVLKAAALATAPTKHQQNHKEKSTKPKPFRMF